MNPYQPPTEAPSRHSPKPDWDIVSHLQSNKAIALVMGIPGILFITIGSVPILSVIAGTNPYAKVVSLTALWIALALIGLGVALLSVAIFLWRYRPPEGTNRIS